MRKLLTAVLIINGPIVKSLIQLTGPRTWTYSLDQSRSTEMGACYLNTKQIFQQLVYKLHGKIKISIKILSGSMLVLVSKVVHNRSLPS